jgi:integrase/recombinase XerC
MDISSFVRYLKYERRFSDHTIRAYQTDLEQFSGWLEATYAITSPREVQHFHIRSWMIGLMDRGLKARSINRKLSSLKSFFRFELRHQRITVDPMQQVIAPKIGKRLPKVVREERLGALFQPGNFSDDFSGLRDRLLLELLYGTGMRRAEVIGLQNNKVDLRAGRIRIFGKGGKERLVPLLDGLRPLLKAYREERDRLYESGPTDPLLVTDKGEAMYPNFVYRKVKKYLSLVSTLDGRSPHVLRHSFATHLTDHGAELQAVKELLGHSSLAATQIYTHNSIEKLRATYEKAHPKAKRSESDPERNQ